MDIVKPDEILALATNQKKQCEERLIELKQKVEILQNQIELYDSVIATFNKNNKYPRGFLLNSILQRLKPNEVFSRIDLEKRLTDDNINIKKQTLNNYIYQLSLNNVIKKQGNGKFSFIGKSEIKE